MSIPRRSVLGLAVAGVAAFFGYLGYVELQGMKPENAARQAYLAKDSLNFENGIKRLIVSMERNNISELAFDGNVISVPEKIDHHSLTILNQESELLNPFFDDLIEAEDGVRKNVDWVVFSPNVTSEHEDVNGLSIGNEIICIDTEADDGGIKNPLQFPSIIGHESEHESNRNAGLSRLEDEKRAYDAGLGVAEHQLQKSRNPLLEAIHNDYAKRVATAEFLQSLGSDFDNVYPTSVILARDLLEANISPEKLTEYRNNFKGSDGIGEELFLAAYFGEIVRTKPREEAINDLYRYVRDSECQNTLIQVSAASALQFLVPDMCEVDTGADIVSGTDRTASICFGSRQKTDNIGHGSTESGLFGVSGLPSLEELLSNKTFDNFVPNSVSGSGGEREVISRFRIYDGEIVTKTIDNDGVPLVYIPGREGKPGPGFFRFYIKASDEDGNGRKDTIMVYYGNNNLSRDDGCILTKVDTYRNQRYVESGLIWFAAKEKGEDADFDVDRFWSEWRME